MRFFCLQCSSKKKLQALIGQWQQKSMGEYHGSILTALENALPLFSEVCTGATSGRETDGFCSSNDTGNYHMSSFSGLKPIQK